MRCAAVLVTPGAQEVEGLEPGSLEPAVDFLAMVDTPYVSLDAPTCRGPTQSSA
jgi:hypothetical protein